MQTVANRLRNEDVRGGDLERGISYSFSQLMYWQLGGYVAGGQDVPVRSYSEPLIATLGYSSRPSVNKRSPAMAPGFFSIGDVIATAECVDALPVRELLPLGGLR